MNGPYFTTHVSNPHWPRPPPRKSHRKSNPLQIRQLINPFNSHASTFSLYTFPLRQPFPTLMATVNRWLRPEVYPLFAAVGVAVGICGMQLVRNICINPEVRVTKEKRSAGVLDNFAEGEKYSEHSLRKFVRNKSPEIMPSINSFFTDPNRN